MKKTFLYLAAILLLGAGCDAPFKDNNSIEHPHVDSVVFEGNSDTLKAASTPLAKPAEPSLDSMMRAVLLLTELDKELITLEDKHRAVMAEIISKYQCNTDEGFELLAAKANRLDRRIQEIKRKSNIISGNEHLNK